MKPRVAISVGCPCGIGPEVAVVAAARFARKARVTLVGDRGALLAAARLRGVDATKLEVVQPTASLPAPERRPGAPGRAAGAAQLAWIDAATDMVRAREADALVTGPVSKDVIARSGGAVARRFRGHTEHLAERLGAAEVTMAFWSEKLTTSLVTTHLALADVPRAITPAAVARATFWTGDFLARLGARGALAVASLNPHAGEGGLLGKEESRAIAPGIRRARARLAKARVAIDVVGPVPAESALRLGATGGYAGVVAMYHDQATIPMKLLGFGEAVNVSLGLPIIRTSVDHGTAYDRAGKGTADARGMLEAIALALRLGA
ncbi:MAG: 4-hydroxythreonine-4-phosphate dehydrogenase PdxA [Labilithrix sp.]|nr:4-hydroxythreonine-4-phosphate dehydrogenase PdxA [Labilithrix sp.]MCW5815964.1 4-hydroxythreonine-4-phosphate dehydrogenase PdxA [Labilithrix sp.]